MQHSEKKKRFHGRRAQVATRTWLKLTSKRKMFSDLLVCQSLKRTHSVRRQLLMRRALFTNRVHYESFLLLPLSLLLSDGPGLVKHIAYKLATILAHQAKFMLLWFMLWNLCFWNDLTPFEICLLSLTEFHWVVMYHLDANGIWHSQNT